MKYERKMIICSVCGHKKPKASDNLCFACYMRLRYRKNPINRERRREQSRISAMKNYMKNKNNEEWRDKNNERSRNWYKDKDNKEIHKKYMSSYYHRNKEKCSIRKKLNNNILLKEEIMKKCNNSCINCKTTQDLEFHHIIYKNNKNSIIVLCRKCHRMEHRIHK